MEMAHRAAIGDDLGGRLHEPGGQERGGEGAVGQAMDDVEAAFMQELAVHRHGAEFEAVVEFVVDVRDALGFAPLRREAVGIVDDEQVDARLAEGAGEMEFDAVVAESGE